MNIREIASRVLRIFEKRKRIPEDEVRKALSRMDDRDRAFFKELVWGVVRKRRLLDWYIDRFLRRKEIPPAVRVLLRMGVYQILFMDSVPDYAAVNETVALAENENFKRLINAILRKVSSMEIEEPSELSLKYSHPEWLVNYWKSFLEEEIVERILKWNMVPSPIVLRVNTLKITREELMELLREEGHGVSETLYSPVGIWLKKLGKSLDDSRVLSEGLATVQGESSQIVPFLMELDSDLTVLDVCSSPGGKTTHIAELMKNKGKILAFDISLDKVEKVMENAKRLGIEIIDTGVLPGEKLSEIVKEKFDRILLDVPCTSLGTIRKNPDVMWRVRKSDFKKLAKLQYELLSSSWKLLKEGGILIYSTCTVTLEENKRIVEKFLAEHDNVEVLNVSNEISEFGIDGIWDGYGFLMLPDETITPFYVSKLRKMG